MRCALIVEDEVGVRSLVGIILEMAGYSVFQAANGADALDMIHRRHEPFDLIILDLRMPQMNGFEFLYRLKRHERAGTPVLAVSADEPAGERAKEFGADGFLAKPFEQKQLLEAINHVIDLQQL